jgi:membrane-bound lytic murein transglycosylase A
MMALAKAASRRIGLSAGILAFALLAGCAPRELPKQPHSDQLSLISAKFSDLSFWTRDRHMDALRAFIRSCSSLLGGSDSYVGGHRVTVEDWAPICRATNQSITGDKQAAQKFFEKWFVPHLVSNTRNSQGLFTGYFEAELKGAKKRSKKYKVPLYGLPNDLIRASDGSFLPYHRRGAIQKGALQGIAPILVWVDDPIDAFLLHVQGSGRVVLEDGAVMRVGYAGNNGHGYVSIGRVLIERGELPTNRAGWAQIRDWITHHPSKAEPLLAQNPRFIFFREVLGEGPIGAQGVALTPRRSLAIDRKFIPLGFPIWLDTVWPGQSDRPLRRLMVAQDTGSAIKGPIRGDFFWGYGKDALAQAGRMKSPGQYYILLPKSVPQPLS